MGAFADRLLKLKEEAGDPSYAEMSARLGAAASKSSLASAAQGRKLPSWETAWEFVRVLAVDRLGRDPEETEREWRELWERAKAVPSPDDTDTDTVDGAAAPMAHDDTAEAGTAHDDGATVGTADDDGAMAGTAHNDEPAPAPPTTAAEVVQAPAPSARRNRVLVSAMIAAAIILVGLTGFYLATTTGQDDPPARTPAKDDSAFVGDITYPDGSEVRPGSSFKKVWRIRNIGTTSWAGRRLARINTGPCRSPETVPIPPTAPGQTADISVQVRAPDKPGNCRIYWKMTDAQGQELFPDKRPVFLDVRVSAP
ncbi:NBR1-Ig-like domain-containing protein [Nonomuraea sp. NPDC048901]|uniref:NBR1-Ig-like domain-containing protein n=1 Tax=Nonomuraea sp. NPDC048901 TaxID=3155627 RepID=UPI0033C0DD45